MTLKEIIIEEIKEPIAQEAGFQTWDALNKKCDPHGWDIAHSKLYKESLDRLDSVMRWASMEGYRLNSKGEWFDPRASGSGTDSQLYDIYKRQNKEKNP